MSGPWCSCRRRGPGPPTTTASASVAPSTGPGHGARRGTRCSRAGRTPRADRPAARRRPVRRDLRRGRRRALDLLVLGASPHDRDELARSSSTSRSTRRPGGVRDRLRRDRPRGRLLLADAHRPRHGLDRGRAGSPSAASSSAAGPPPRRWPCSCATPSTTSASAATSGSATASTRPRAAPPSGSASSGRAGSATRSSTRAATATPTGSRSPTSSGRGSAPALDAWLDDRNFDDMGRQRVRLAARPPSRTQREGAVTWTSASASSPSS